MTLSDARLRLLADLGLDDLVEPARDNVEIGRADLGRVLAAGHPLAAAALADARREAVSGVDVTHPHTLRVRGPAAPEGDRTTVSFAPGDLVGIPATEMQLLGPLLDGSRVDGAPLDQVLETVKTLHDERPDLPLRALTPGDVAALSGREGRSTGHVLDALADAGLATLDWRCGEDTTPEAFAVHEAAHERNIRSSLVVAYGNGGVDAGFLDTLERLRTKLSWSAGWLALVPLPAHRELRSPLQGTAGTEDCFAFSLVRLALGHIVKRVTVDAHVLGHKLGAVLLAHGADDFVGAQAARAWAPPSDDGPRPLNPDRVRAHLIEARRSPVLRDGLFRPVAS